MAATIYVLHNIQSIPGTGTEPKRTDAGTGTFKILRTGTGTETFILINKGPGPIRSF